MIQTDKLVFVENPGTDSDYVADILLEQFGGFRITPKEAPQESPVDSHLVFTVVRNPSHRMASLISDYGRGEPALEEFFEQEWPGFHTKLQSYWTQNCHEVIRYEDMPQALEAVLLKAGYTGFDLLPWSDKSLPVEDNMQKFLEKKGEDYSLWPKKRGRPPKKSVDQTE